MRTLLVSLTALSLLAATAEVRAGEVRVEPPLDQLPDAVVVRIDQMLRGAELVAARREVENGAEILTVEFRHSGGRHEAYFLPNGQLAAAGRLEDFGRHWIVDRVLFLCVALFFPGLLGAEVGRLLARRSAGGRTLTMVEELFGAWFGAGVLLALGLCVLFGAAGGSPLFGFAYLMFQLGLLAGASACVLEAIVMSLRGIRLRKLMHGLIAISLVVGAGALVALIVVLDFQTRREYDQRPRKAALSRAASFKAGQ